MRSWGWMVFPALACLVLAGTPSAHASGIGAVHGTATSCSGLGACIYKLTNANGTGSVTTTTAFGNYASFQLPGEVNATRSAAYSWTDVNVSGTTNHIQGTFIATDVNTGKVVFGKTDANVTKTTHCYRTGCSNSYALINGTVSVQVSSLDGTTLLFSCNPSSYKAGHSTTCTATVTDSANLSFHPTGNITMKTQSVGVGHFFSKGICRLKNGTCSLKFKGTDDFVGTATLAASYPGNSIDYLSSAFARISVS
jgi:hypothetical protein